MGLISKEVEILLNSKNIKRYEDLGYEIPRYYNKHEKTMCVKRGTKIKIKVEDLPTKSHTRITVRCDYCDKEYELKYQDYTKCNHDGKIYCKICSSTVLTSKEKNGMFGFCRYGKNNPNYNPNKTDEEREQGRCYPEYTEFIKKVLIRDNYTCKCCGDNNTKHDIEVHHLDGYDWCKEKRTDESNGITLCKNCHKNFHSIYGFGNNTKEQFEEWIGNAIGELEKYNGELPTARKIYCVEENKIYDNALELAKEWNTSFPQIYAVCNHKKTKKGYCKSVKGKHLLWLDEYEKCTEADIQRYLDWCKPKQEKQVLCITTGRIFSSIQEASNYYNIKSYSNISSCCTGKLKACGKLEDGTSLQWQYYEDYLK